MNEILLEALFGSSIIWFPIVVVTIAHVVSEIKNRLKGAV